MQKYAVQLSYLGEMYCGWQKQKGSAARGKPSIQATIEDVLKKMTGEKVSVVGSGRTDAGVNAAGQVAHFVLKEKEWIPIVLQKGMNALLPQDIRVLELKTVEPEFHAQRSAKKKQYSYYFQQGPCALPHLKNQSWWRQKTLDVKAMQRALNVLIGEHDFKAFQASGAATGPTVREIYEADVTVLKVEIPSGFETKVKLIRVRIVGSGFLKQMVRGIAGTLRQIGEGLRPAEDMSIILKTMDRKKVGPTAPPQALWLERVWYE